MKIEQSIRPSSKIIMASSAILLGLTGVILLFLPQEVAAILTLNSNGEIILQIIGALYFGFAMSNWTAKHSILGGIYGRAIIIGNLSHFFTGGLLIMKYYMKNSDPLFLGLSIVYLGFMLIFGYLFFNNPKSVS